MILYHLQSLCGIGWEMDGWLWTLCWKEWEILDLYLVMTWIAQPVKWLALGWTDAVQSPPVAGIFLCATTTGATLGSVRTPIQCVPEALSPIWCWGQEYVRVPSMTLCAYHRSNLAITQVVPTVGHPGFDPRSDHVGFVVDRVQLGQVLSEHFGSPANSHSTDCSTLIIIWGWYNGPNSGRLTKWIQSHPTPRN
jgi:hypothetical protein